MAGLECADFDKGYLRMLYDHNSVIVAFATEGIQRACDRNIRDISGEIRTGVSSHNLRIDKWAECAGATSIPVSFDRAQRVVDSVSEPRGECFDIAYAKQMVGLLDQAKDASVLAAEKSTIPEIRKEAAGAAKHFADWSYRLQRWLTRKGA